MSTPISPSAPAHDAAPVQPTSTRPGRGQRRGWNTATAIVGGLSALGLLAAGSGAATAAVMAQERSGSWDTPAKVTSIDVDAPVATVHVVTSTTVDRPTVRWRESGWGLGEPPRPQVTNGTLRLDVPQPHSWGNSVAQDISITVPRTGPEVSLDLTTTVGVIQVTGDFKSIRAGADYGAINASDVKATVLDARATNGQVFLDGVSVRDRLDAHTQDGVASVRVKGTAPRQASVTSDTGSYAVSFPRANYWYPQESAQDFTDPKLPRTTDPTSRSSSWSSESGPSEKWGGPSAESDEPSGTGSGVSTTAAKDVCAQKPTDRPCLFLHGIPTAPVTESYPQPWADDWDDLTDPLD